MRWAETKEKLRQHGRDDESQPSAGDHDLEVSVSMDEDTDARPPTKKETKRLLRKIDRNLIPLICVLYLISVLDRANLGHARRMGLGDDLHLVGKHDFNIAKSIFFPFFLIVQIPSNLLLQRVRPSLWIPSLMIGWSAVTIFLGLVKNLAGLLALRCLLGIVEGGVFPGFVLYLTKWYQRDEYGYRISLFYSPAILSGSLNGFLGKAITGIGDMYSWPWVFFIEGIVSLVVSGFAFLLMHDWPCTAKFLKPAEKQVVLRRLHDDASHLSDRIDAKFVKQALLDWKIWVHMAMTVGVTVPLYSMDEFLPVIIEDLGYHGNRELLMALPQQLAAALATIGVGIAADRCRQRGVFTIGLCVTAMTGFVMLGVSENHVVKYLACFLVAMGIHPIVPQDVGWNANNIGGSTKRAVGIAMHFGFGNLGGAVAAFVIREDNARRFISGHGILFLTTAVSCMLATFMTWYLRRENARRDRVYKRRELYTTEEMLAESDLGDEATFFRYYF
ncbi:major facilitator superfamily protein [Hirsutella rhossiliensis]|uniref:Major facilitator superfamily domain-containing protein n=1 Tax=Hirsutella rhossiliensis TaxID=111463 RepID=A0A9P8N674_9HYPO|nr:major facilitator superfamily domain-containing protein [Hirsutella rhossiliensis]KAH0966524.1 major facilitator superfamily domain-containing protein [Hirsutella rhossiliensis]